MAWRRIDCGSPGKCLDTWRRVRLSLKPGQGVRVLDDSGTALMAHRRADR